MESRKILWVSIIAVLVIILILFGYILFQKQAASRPDPVAEQCSFFCESQQKTGFCSFTIEVEGERTTCVELANAGLYGVQACPSISCALTAEEADKTCVTGLGGKWETPVNGICPQSGTRAVRQINSSDSAPTAGQICCR